MAEEEVQTEETPTDPPVETPEEAPVEAPEATPDDDWRASIEDEKARKFADSFTSPAAAAESAFKMRQQLSKAIVPPGKDADEDAMADYRKKIGVPESPEGYELKPSENLPEEVREEVFESDEGKTLLNDFIAKMHATNATPAQVQTAVDAYMGYIVAGQQASNEEMQKKVESLDNDLKREWGKDAEANERFGKQAVKTFDTDGSLTDMLEEATYQGVQLGNHPAFRKTFAQIGRSMGEDGFQVTPSGEEAESLQGKLDELMGLLNTDPEKYKSPAVQRQIDQINEKLHGDGPIVGAEGRAA